MVHTLPVKGKSAMLNIAEQLGIRNAHRYGLRPYRTRNNSGGSSAEETAAGQGRRLAGHGPVSITGRRPEPGVMVGAMQAITRFDHGECNREIYRQSTSSAKLRSSRRIGSPHSLADF